MNTRTRFFHKGGLEQRIRLAAFSLAMLVTITFGSVTLTSQINRARESQLAYHHATLSLLSNTLRISIENHLNILNDLSNTSLIWTAISDSYGRDAYLKPFLDSLNNTGKKAMQIGLYDYRGRWVSGEHTQSQEILDSSALLIEKTIATRQPAAVLVKDGSARLLLAFPVHYPYTDDMIGVLLGDLSLDLLLDDKLKDMDSTLGYSIKLNGSDLSASSSPTKKHYQAVHTEFTYPQSPSLYRFQIELFGTQSAWYGLLAKQGGLFLAAALILAWIIWLVSSLLAKQLSLRLTRLSNAVSGSGAPCIEDIPSDDQGDEISHLACVLKEALSEHDQIKNQLEQLVAERTQELSASRQRYQLAVDGTRDGIWDWEISSGKAYFSPRWKEMLGYTEDELENDFDTFIKLIHPEDKDYVLDILNRHLASDEAVYQAEFRMQHKDGSWRWINARGIALRDDQGKPYRMAGSHTDITERRQSDDLLHTLFTAVEQSPITVVIADLDANIEYVNPQFTEVTGYTAAEAKGQNPRILQSGHTSVESYLHMWETLTSGQVWKGELENKRKNGELYWEEVQIAPVKDARNITTHYVAVKNDVTERKRAEANLRLAASVFTHAREGIIITDKQANIIDVNATFTQITGYSREEVLGKNPRILSSGQQDAAFYAEMWREVNEKDFWQGELWDRRKNGEIYAEWLTISTVRDREHEIKYYLAIFNDITEQKEHQRYIEHIAHHDALTGLPNRALLADRLNQSMAIAFRHNQPLAVAYIDLDGFKLINDNHGHHVGDILLTQIASRLRNAVRSGDTVARLGGDEFVAVLQDLTDINASVPLLLRLLAAAAQPFEVDHLRLRVSASIGVTYYPQEDDVDADQLLRQADQSMYQAKQAGKNRYHVFDAALDRSVRGYHENMLQLQQALTNGEFVLYYQPKVNMRSGVVVGAEALIRWQHPQQGLLSPAEFLPVLEEHPLSIELGEWVVDTVLSQIKAWTMLGLVLPVSVNIGAHQLQQADFIKRLQLIMARYPEVKPQYLELEVLESSALGDLVQVTRLIHACREIGVKFALDDFGTGYSSLTYLKRLPADVLKIDQSFVCDMLDNPESIAIVEGILSLSYAFHREVIAEGVETLDHGLMLLRLGCELAQGYAIAPAMPAHELPDWAAAWRNPEVWQEISPFNRDDFAIIHSAVEHRGWIVAIMRHLQGEAAAPLALDYQNCLFGKWLQSEARTRHNNPQGILAVEALHEQITLIGQRLLDLKAEGRDEEVRAQMDELLRLSPILLAQLWTLGRTKGTTT